MKAEDNEYPYITIEETAVPATPDAGDQRLYIDPADHLLKLVDAAGAVSGVGGGGGGGGTVFAGAKAYSAVTQAVTTGADRVITFDSEDWDTHAFHSVVTNTGRFTIPTGKAGKYLLTGTQYDASPLSGKQWDAAARYITSGTNATSKAVEAAAGYLIGDLCVLTHNQPAAVCSQVPAVLKGITTSSPRNQGSSVPSTTAQSSSTTGKSSSTTGKSSSTTAKSSSTTAKSPTTTAKSPTTTAKKA